jgi:hypothetical protein
VDELIKKYKDVDPFLVTKWERIFTLFFGERLFFDSIKEIVITIGQGFWQ